MLAVNRLISLIAGAMMPFAIAPYTYWWLALISLALLAYSLHSAESKKAVFGRVFLFALACYTAGIYWIYISINVYGSAPMVLAVSMMAIFIVFLAVVFSLPFLLLPYAKHKALRLLLGVPLCWALSEWLRGWVLTGFPWLYLGYAHYETPLIGWAPIGGVLLIGFFSALSSSALTFLLLHKQHSKKILTGLALIWAVGALLPQIQWTQTTGEDIRIGIIQPNIPLEQKWDASYRQSTVNILDNLSAPLWQEVDWLFWPEAAIPDLHSRAQDIIPTFNQLAEKTSTSLVTGLLYDDRQERKIFNSVVGLGDASGRYYKQRLVPFGEYVPLEAWLRGLIDFFNLPNSHITAGLSDQKNLQLGDYRLASAICYEIVYPALVAELAKDAHAILTISNDAWFGESIGPWQHFHMARMRALETGRYVLRSTNNGVSAVISPKGEIQSSVEQFKATALSDKIQAVTGHTPFMRWKNMPLLLLLLLAMGVLLLWRKPEASEV